MKVRYCLVFRNVGDDKFYEFGNLFYNQESKNLIVVSDGDYQSFESERDDDCLIQLDPESELDLPFSYEEAPN